MTQDNNVTSIESGYKNYKKKSLCKMSYTDSQLHHCICIMAFVLLRRQKNDKIHGIRKKILCFWMMVFIFIEYHRQRCTLKLNTNIYGWKPLNRHTGLLEPVMISLHLNHEFDVNNRSTQYSQIQFIEGILY